MPKQTHTEVNYLPIPSNIAGILRQSGLMPYCYYENVRSAPKDFSELRTFDFYCLLQLVDGECYLQDDSHPVAVRIPDEGGLIVTPGNLHQYGAMSDFFVEDSICFYGPTADAFFRAGIIRQGVLRFGKERLLLPVIEKIRTGLLTGYIEANTMLQQLLLELYWRNNSERDSDSGDKITRLIQRINHDPREMWTVKKMARFCHISENHLRRLFHRQTGMSPKQYIEQFKIRMAGELLVGTELKIASISAKLGYDDPYHFSRRFKEKTGVSPAAYRKKQKKLRGFSGG